MPAPFALLVERGLDDEAAEHAVQADLAGDAAAIAVLERVGRTARGRGATQSAISVLRSAVALAGAHASSELLCDLAAVLATGGRPADAKDLCLRILQRADLPILLKARTLRALARAHAYLGEFDAAARRVDECVGLVEKVEPEFAVETLLAYARVSQFVAGPAATLPVMARARAIARRCDAPFRWSCDAGWALSALETGDPSGIAAARAAAIAFEATSAAADRRTLVAGGGALATYAIVAKYTDHLAESEHYFRVRLRLTEQLGSVDEEAAALVGCCGTLVRMLRIDEAAALVERCAGLADLVPPVAPFTAVDRANLFLLMGRLTESEEAARQADAALAAIATLTGQGAWQPSLFLRHGRALRCLAEGRLADACVLYEQIEAITARVGFREPCEVPWAVHAVAAYLGSGRRPDAERVAAWLEECAGTLPCRYPQIAVAHARALLTEAAGDQARADGLFQQAMAIHDEVDLPLERLTTLLEYGRFLRRTGQLQRARRLLAQAIAVAEAAGAHWLASQASQELRVAGGRRRDKGDPGRLTAQEERVAALAASGAANADIAGALYVSVNTVETHLQHIYAKLGIQSRRQLPAALAARKAD